MATTTAPNGWVLWAWLYSGILSVVSTGTGLVCLVVGYIGFTDEFNDRTFNSQHEQWIPEAFAGCSLFLGAVLIIFVLLWNIFTLLFLRLSHQMKSNIERVRRSSRKSANVNISTPPCQVTTTSVYKLSAPSSPTPSAAHQDLLQHRCVAQVAVLSTLALLLLCIILELAGTGLLWWTKVELCDGLKKTDQARQTTSPNTEDLAGCSKFSVWFQLLRVLLPLLALLQLPVLVVNCGSWVCVKLKNGHPLEPEPEKIDTGEAKSVKTIDPVKYYHNMCEPLDGTTGAPLGDRPATIGQDSPPKLATTHPRPANTYGGPGRFFRTGRLTCVACPVVPPARLDEAGVQCSTPVHEKMRVQMSSPITPVQGAVQQLGEVVTLHYNCNLSTSMRRSPLTTRIRSPSASIKSPLHLANSNDHVFDTRSRLASFRGSSLPEPPEFVPPTFRLMRDITTVPATPTVLPPTPLQTAASNQSFATTPLARLTGSTSTPQARLTGSTSPLVTPPTPEDDSTFRCSAAGRGKPAPPQKPDLRRNSLMHINRSWNVSTSANGSFRGTASSSAIDAYAYSDILSISRQARKLSTSSSVNWE